MIKKILVTGGNGFIGQNFLNFINQKKKYNIVNIDSLSGSSDRNAHKKFENIRFYKENLINKYKIKKIIIKFKPDLVVNFAAHSHVDKSIKNSEIFLENIVGTHNLLSVCLDLFRSKKNIKFLQVSTDEVFGSIKLGKFKSNSPYKPNSPYSASKASADHLVRAFNKTYGLPTLITYSCNNFGPYQHLEKLIPLTILSYLKKDKMGIYGKGNQKRQWIYVMDNVKAIYSLIGKNFTGRNFCIGSKNEMSNIDLVKKIIKIIKKKNSILENDINFDNHIKFVKDRPGHDYRYNLDYQDLKKYTGWTEKYTLNQSLNLTIDWYLDNLKWIQDQEKSLEKFKY
jgi:dTDP-glucose 4,6-dehydratase